MNHDLNFSEFETCDKTEWLQLLQKELGERTYDSLVWKDENKLKVEPYPEPASAGLNVPQSNPRPWLIAQRIDASAPGADTNILKSLTGGAEMLEFDCHGEDFFDANRLLKDVFLEAVEIQVRNHPNALLLLENLQQYAIQRGYKKEDLLIKSLAVVDMTSVQPVLAPSTEINAALAHNLGATVLQELAFALAVGHEQLLHALDAGHTPHEAAQALQFRFAIGSSFFVEIAKLRAFRALWQQVVAAYNSGPVSEIACTIAAETSLRTYTRQDLHNNLLRATTQCMSAVLGGANAVIVWPYNHLEYSEDPQGMRLALNIQHLLREESYLDNALHAAHGSYYLQQLELQLAENAWHMFQTMEAAGGFFKYQSSFMQEVESAKSIRNVAIQDGTKTVVGVNKYQLKKASA